MALKKADLLKKNLKKEKKSNLVIGDKSYNFYKIIWEDITGDSTIVSFNDFDKMETSIITTFAYIYKKNDKYLWTFASYSDDGFFGDRNIIPLGCIKSIEKKA
jgi:hypothetical protein